MKMEVPEQFSLRAHEASLRRSHFLTRTTMSGKPTTQELSPVRVKQCQTRSYLGGVNTRGTQGGIGREWERG